MKTKEYWWISVGGNDCELALIVKDDLGAKIFTFGCSDSLSGKDVVLVEELKVLPPRGLG